MEECSKRWRKKYCAVDPMRDERNAIEEEVCWFLETQKLKLTTKRRNVGPNSIVCMEARKHQHIGNPYQKRLSTFAVSLSVAVL